MGPVLPISNGKAPTSENDELVLGKAEKLSDTTGTTAKTPSDAIGGIKETRINGSKSSDEETSSPLTDAISGAKDPSSAVKSTIPKVSPQILYKINYENETGDLIHSIGQDKPFSDVKEEEENVGGGPIFEIVLTVTVHNQTLAAGLNATPLTADYIQKILKDGKDEQKVKVQDNDPDGNQVEEKDEVSTLSSLLRIRYINYTEMVVKSPKLLNAIRSIVEYYPSQSLAGENVRIKEPYSVLLHHRNQLENICKSFEEGSTGCHCGKQDICDCVDGNVKHDQLDQETIDHIRVLLNYLNANYKKKMEAEEQRWRNSTPTATWDMIWMLLQPGIKVYTEMDNKLAGFIVKSAETDTGLVLGNSRPPWRVTLWNLNYDGRHIGRTSYTVYIRHFDGEMDITSLKVFPIQYRRDKQGQPTLESSLLARGKRYYGVLKEGYIQTDYSGDSVGLKKRRYKGRVIFDPASYYQTEDGSAKKPELGGIEDDGTNIPDRCSCDSCKASRKRQEAILREQGFDKRLESRFRYSTLEDIDPKIDRLDPMDEELIYFLLPRKMPGFILKERTWQMLDISYATENFVTNTIAIESLAMPRHQLDMIKALSAKFSQTQTWAADFIPNKGEGQIFLLHGPPGVGKTYTAECIAEFTSRPLLALTCADIGTDEMNTEKNLGQWFALAETWGAVMLIDEADVYLEERQSGDLQRNSLVSAFLRSMEYYRGILFLTTNRIGHMDTAIMSRVHVIIRYDPLTDKQRTKIWNQFFEKLERERADIMVEPKARFYILDETIMKRVVWNGREIRNAFQTAVALAENDLNAKKEFATNEGNTSEKLQGSMIILKEKHFMQVVEMARDFKKWYNDSFGTEAKRAEWDRARRDIDPNESSKPTKKGKEKKLSMAETTSKEYYSTDEDV